MRVATLAALGLPCCAMPCADVPRPHYPGERSWIGSSAIVARLVSLVTTHSVLSPDALHGMNQDAAIDYRPFQKDCGYNPISLDEGFARVFEGR